MSEGRTQEQRELSFLEDILENFQSGGDGIWAAQKLVVLRIEQLRAEAALRAETPPPRDEECICQGNWRKLAQETETLFGKEFESNGDVYTLEGLVHTEEDYYYGMRRQRDGRWTLLSCVANIEGHHFKRRAAGKPEQAK